MAIDIRRGQTFVQAHGTPLERARLAALLGGARPGDVPPELHALQNPDGGFPYRLQIGLPSTLNHTVQVLQWLDDLRLGDAPVAGGARAFLRSRQTRGGIWREDRMLQQYDDLSPGMDSELTAADVYTTALCGAALIVDDAAIVQIDRAMTWLQTQQGRDGLLQGFKARASAIALPVFEHLLGEEARPTRRLIAGLGHALMPDWDGGMLTELLFRLRQAGYGFHTEVVVRAWDQLQAAQAPDGSITTEEHADTLEATIRALDIAYSVEQAR